MPKHLYLIKEGEISLKGLNRGLFEKRLKNNIKDKLRPYHSTTQRQKGRIFLFVDEECPRERIEKALSTTFGIVGWAEAVMCEKRLETILEKAKELLLKWYSYNFRIAYPVYVGQVALMLLVKYLHFHLLTVFIVPCSGRGCCHKAARTALPARRRFVR